ncbi:hypothetical protein B0O99DRAFT_685351 [Bisporella sp. PMI_857]|nr:hypothetical protein B0O99DRAFT_685351 [Bisporella sp. PMI_857]
MGINRARILGAGLERNTMQQAQATVEDSRLDTERRLICNGSALVRFEYPKCNEYIKRNKGKRRPDPEHVERVKRIYSRAGCRPLEITRHIPAILSQQELDTALEDARRRGRWKTEVLPPINTTDGYPELEFPAVLNACVAITRLKPGKSGFNLARSGGLSICTFRTSATS